MSPTALRLRPVHDILLIGDDEVKIGLYHLSLATAEQLCRLHYSPGSIKKIKERLKELTDGDYLTADVIPSRELRKPYYYALTQKGLKYLEQLGIDSDLSWRPPKDRHGLFIQHSLEINDLIIAGALLTRSDPRFRLHDFMSERALKRKPVKVVTPSEGNTALIPDAFLDFRIKRADGTYRSSVLLEHDRDTEEQQHFRRRIQAYIAFLKAGMQEQAFGVKSVLVAFTTFEGEDRLGKMRAWTRAELAQSGSAQQFGSMFAFASLTQPAAPTSVWLSPIWYLPSESSRAEPLLLAD